MGYLFLELIPTDKPALLWLLQLYVVAARLAQPCSVVGVGPDLFQTKYSPPVESSKEGSYCDREPDA